MKNYLLILSLFLTACTTKMIEFNPIEKQGDTYVEVKSHADSIFLKNIEQVLNYYDVAYEKHSDSKIFIEEAIYEDKDLMYNYTIKAKDDEWLKDHKE